MTDLAARYGSVSRARRWTVAAVVVVLALAGLGWVAWAVASQSSPEVRSELVAFDVRDDHAVEARFRVVRRSTGVVATCALRAIAVDHSVVGEASVSVDTGGRERTVTTSIRTERRATSVELLGCTAAGQSRRR